MRRAAQLLRFHTLASQTQRSCVGHLEHIAAQEHHLLRSNRLRHLWLQQGRSFADVAPSSKTTSKSPVTFQTLFWTLFAGAGLVAGVRQYQDSKLKEAMSKSQQVAGKAAVGGPFDLIDQDGKRFTHENLLGQFSVMYFGFTHCPDICPDELEKLGEALDKIEEQTGVQVRPVFISVDPERDTPKLVKSYVKEFHPRLIGLTGSVEAVKSCSKLYRVYFHKTDDSPTDYLVDHSIIMYLMDPEGEFVTFYGKNFTAQQLADSISEHLVAWAAQHSDYKLPKAWSPPSAVPRE